MSRANQAAQDRPGRAATVAAPAAPKPIGSWSLYRRLLHLIWPYWFQIGVILLMTLVSVGFNIIRPWPTAVLVDVVLREKSIQETLGPRWAAWLGGMSKGTLLQIAVFTTLALLLIEGIHGIFKDLLVVRVGYRMVLDFRSMVFRHLQRLSLRFHDNTRAADSAYRATSNTFAVQSIFQDGVLTALGSSMTLVGMFAVMVCMDWQLTFLSLLVAPLMFGSIMIYKRRIEAKAKHAHEMESAINSAANEALGAIRVVKSFGMEEVHQAKFEGHCRRSMRAYVNLTVFQTGFGLLMNLATGLGTAGIMWLGGRHVLEGRLSLKAFLAFTGYMASLYKPLSSLSYMANSVYAALGSARRVYEVLDTEIDIADKPDAIDLPAARGEVEFRGVSFAYDPEHPVLDDVSFRVLPGQVVAFVGPTGVGKSTLLSLLVRFYDPPRGRILLDGHDLRDITLASLRAQVAMVLQDTILFSASIYENIAYGRPDAGEDEILHAAKLAEAHDFVLGLPQGYKTQVGERGVKLSGGQRQRISIARAFLRDAPILLLDEPTSALDSRTEAALMTSLERLMEGRTTFIVAHRLSTVVHADQIFVLEHGRVIERGTHAELLAAGAAYGEMFRRQLIGSHRAKAGSTG